jgi:hypothetical protein
VFAAPVPASFSSNPRNHPGQDISTITNTKIVFTHSTISQEELRMEHNEKTIVSPALDNGFCA